MIKNFNVLAIVPARGGSKRIPKKNIKELGGKPLIVHTFDEAKKSKYIDRLIVSTEDAEIANISRRFGVEVPFVRPGELAQDLVTDFAVFEHALEWFSEKEDYKPDIIVQLRPTSPLRVVAQIDEAIELLADHPEADSVRTVTEPEQSPYKMYKITDSGYLEPLLTLSGVSEVFNMPSQKLPPAYKHVGYVDVIWYKTITEKKQMTGDRIVPLVLPNAVSGLNTPDQWDLYEFLMEQRYQGK